MDSDSDVDDINQKKKSTKIQIEPFGKNKLLIIYQDRGFFIIDTKKYDINQLMMRIDLKRINRIEQAFRKPGNEEGLEKVTFIKTVKNEITTNPEDKFDEINLLYVIFKMFCETDLSGDGVIQWSEYTQFMIDRVEGETESNITQEQIMKEKEMIKYKRYLISEIIRDLNIHKERIISSFYQDQIDSLIICEYNSSIFKYYNLKTGRCHKTQNIKNAVDAFKNGEYSRLKENGIKDINEKDLYKIKNFSVLSVVYSEKKKVIGLCSSSSEIYFFTVKPNGEFKCIFVIETPILQKKLWYLPKNNLWFSSGRKEAIDGCFYIYELDVDFQKNSSMNRIECLNNGKNCWFRQKYYELTKDDIDNENRKLGRNDKRFNPSVHKAEICDVIEIYKPMLILTACLDGLIRLININDHNFIKYWVNPNDNIKFDPLTFGKVTRKGFTSIVYNPSIDVCGLILATGFHYDIPIYATDLSIANAYKGKLEGHNAPVISVSFLSNSYMCASVDEDSFVKIFDTKSRQCLQSISPEKKNVMITKILHIPKYNRIALTGNKIIFLDPKYSEEEINRQKLNLLNVDNFPIQCYFNNYHMAFFVITSKELKVYSAADGKLIHSFKKFLEQERFDSDVTIKKSLFDSRHRLIYLGFSNGTIQQFNAGNGSLIKAINEYEVESEGLSYTKTHHKGEVTDMFLYILEREEQCNNVFILGTSGVDSLVHMYDERNPEESTKLRTYKNSHKRGNKRSEILHMDFSQLLLKFATSSADGLVCVWNFEKSKLEELCYYPDYNSGSFSVTALKFLEPFPVLAVAYSTACVFLYGVGLKYSGKCFFRFDNIILNHNESIVNSTIQSLFFVYNREVNIPVNINFTNDLMNKVPSDVVVDEDLQKLAKNTDDKSIRAFLIIGDDRGYLRLIDVMTIFGKYGIQEEDISQLQTTFNILKKEEINAQSSLIYLLQKEKELEAPSTLIYPYIIINEQKIHNDSIIHISYIEKPISLITCSKDKYVRIWDLKKYELVGEIYTGSDTPKKPLIKWNFIIDWDKLKQEEMREFLDIVRELGVPQESYLLSMEKLKDPKYDINRAFKKEREEELQKELELKKLSELFSTEIDNNFYHKFTKKKAEKTKKMENIENMNLNESYDQKIIKEDCRVIEELMKGKGEEKGINEMKNKVIDQLTNGEDIMELFENVNKDIIDKKVPEKNELLPKLYANKNRFSYNTQDHLYSEKFLINSDDNKKRSNILLPMLSPSNNNYDSLRYRPGETEKILANEYYNNAYKRCCQLSNKNADIKSIRYNYKKMWDMVGSYKSNFNSNNLYKH